jgi:tetratricopeptide (TPR) repeat protein/tRNA A-37 threonylcarbamoyl transferase component Bud32
MSHAHAGERTWIDAAADRFECDWKRDGDRPRIEDYLAGRSEPGRTVLLQELLRVECELRKSAGETPRRDDYRQRFPDDSSAIDAVLGIEAHPAKSASEPPADAARGLLFGLLALQNNFVDREALLAAFNAWVADKSQSMGQILLDRGALNAARHAVLQVLVQEHLQQHGFDPERSLAVLTVGPSVRDDLEELPDFDLQTSLLYLRLGADADADADTDTDGERTTDWVSDSAATDTDGRFRIVRFHDRGALGEVYVARDQQLHRIVALKRIKRDHAADQDKRARFVVEAEITGRLEHPGIVPVYGLGTYDDGRPFYAMRFIRGDNLKSAIEQFHQAEEKGRDPGERMLALFKLLRRFLDVCNAIDYAHSRGVLHRDLKPGNIMLGKFGETLVVDWGLAKSVGRPEAVPMSPTLDDRTLVPQSGSDLRETALGARLGTPAYMSPEQAAGKIDTLGPASDVYSLGATLYCLLTGRAPFIDHDMADLLHKVERGEFPPPRRLKGWVDPALEAISLKAMATDPAGRYNTPRALADDVEHWLADEPVSAWREPVRRRLRRWGRRHRLLVTSLAATLVVAVAALAVGDVLIARQRDRAERNLGFARTVVEEMYTQVAAKLDDQEQMDDYQREILEKALKFYGRFALPQSRDPSVRLEAGQISVRVGEIRHRLGQGDAAQGAYRQAIDVLSRLASDHPVELGPRDSLAQAEFGLATFFKDNDLWQECLAEAGKAVAIWAALAVERPGDAGYRQRQAECAGILAEAYQHLGRLDETDQQNRTALGLAEGLAKEHPDSNASRYLLGNLLYSSARPRWIRRDELGHEANLARALSIFAALVRQNPKVKKYRVAMGECYLSLGNAYLSLKRFAECQLADERGLAIFEGLANEHSQCIHCKLNLARIFDVRQTHSLVKGDQQDAALWAGRAIEAYRLLARPEVGRLRARRHLCAALENRAEIWTRLGRYAEALADYEEVLALFSEAQKLDPDEGPEVLDLYHALTKSRLGDLSALARLGEQVRVTLRARTGIGAGYWMTYFDAACVHAALARLGQSDQAKTLVERQRDAEHDLDRTLELLEKSRETGEFSGMIRLDEVRRERLLDPLRSNPRFQLLLMDLAFPDSPLRAEGGSP